MLISRICACFIALALSAATASAMTVGFTEGKRDRVLDTTVVNPTDATNSPPGFPLTPDLGFGGTEARHIELFGRIVGAVDVFEFTSTTSFVINFIFGGYDLHGGGSVATSGFIREGNNNNTSDFELGVLNPNLSILQSVALTTNITSAAQNGGNSEIFAGGPGTFQLLLDGTGGAALYDIRISAVPLPAALPLFAGALGLIGLLGWRRKRFGAA